MQCKFSVRWFRDHDYEAFSLRSSMLEANSSNRVTSFGYQMGKYAIGGRGSQRCDVVSYRLMHVFLVS